MQLNTTQNERNIHPSLTRHNPLELLEATSNIERRKAVLNGQLEALSDQEISEKVDSLAEVAQRTFNKIPRKEFKKAHSLGLPMGIALEVKSPEFMEVIKRSTSNYPGILLAAADVKSDRVILSAYLLLAPREVVRLMIAHEMAHLILNRVGVPNSPQSKRSNQYFPELQREEDAVDAMILSWKMDYRCVQDWAEAIEEGGDHWRTMYERIRSKRRVL